MREFYIGLTGGVGVGRGVRKGYAWLYASLRHYGQDEPTP